MSDGSCEEHVVCLSALPVSILEWELSFGTQIRSNIFIKNHIIKHEASTTYNLIISLNLALVLGLIEGDIAFKVISFLGDGVDASIKACISTLKLIGVKEVVVHSSDMADVSCVPGEECWLGRYQVDLGSYWDQVVSSLQSRVTLTNDENLLVLVSISVNGVCSIGGNPFNSLNVLRDVFLGPSCCYDQVFALEYLSIAVSQKV